MVTSGIVLYHCHGNSFLQVVPLSMMTSDKEFVEYMTESNNRSACQTCIPIYIYIGAILRRDTQNCSYIYRKSHCKIAFPYTK